MELAKKYNLEFGSITKDFKTQWQKILSERRHLAEQQEWLEQLKRKPRIDYENIHVKEQTPEEKLHEEMVEQIMHEVLIWSQIPGLLMPENQSHLKSSEGWKRKRRQGEKISGLGMSDPQ